MISYGQGKQMKVAREQLDISDRDISAQVSQPYSLVLCVTSYPNSFPIDVNMWKVICDVLINSCISYTRPTNLPCMAVYQQEFDMLFVHPLTMA